MLRGLESSSTTEGRVHVKLLGEIDCGYELPKKGKCLIAFLSRRTDRSAPRELLAHVLWPYQRCEGARHSLRNLLLTIKKDLPGVVLADRAACRLSPDVETDADRLVSLAASDCIADMRDAASLYTGEFAEFLHISSEPWDEWVGPVREELVEIYLRMRLRLVKALSLAGEHDEAIAVGGGMVRSHPFCEAAHRNLARAYARASRRGEGIRQLDRCAQILRVELGVNPSANTAALRQWLAESRPSMRSPQSGG